MCYIVEYSEMYILLSLKLKLLLGFKMVIMAKRAVEILKSGCDFKGKCELF